MTVKSPGLRRTRRHPEAVPTLVIKTGLTRWRAGTTSLRDGGPDYHLDGHHVGSRTVIDHRPIRLPIAVGEHLVEVRQTGTRDGVHSDGAAGLRGAGRGAAGGRAGTAGAPVVGLVGARHRRHRGYLPSAGVISRAVRDDCEVRQHVLAGIRGQWWSPAAAWGRTSRGRLIRSAVLGPPVRRIAPQGTKEAICWSSQG